MIEPTNALQETFYHDLIKLLDKHAGNLQAEEFLAVAANVVGKIIAMQDWRTMTPDRAMKIVMDNLRIGNEQVLKKHEGETH